MSDLAGRITAWLEGGRHREGPVTGTELLAVVDLLLEARVELERGQSPGMTPEEARLFELSGELASGLRALPPEHPEEWPELAVALHVIQNKLMARPTRRRLGLVKS